MRPVVKLTVVLKLKDTVHRGESEPDDEHGLSEPATSPAGARVELFYHTDQTETNDPFYYEAFGRASSLAKSLDATLESWSYEFVDGPIGPNLYPEERVQ